MCCQTVYLTVFSSGVPAAVRARAEQLCRLAARSAVQLPPLTAPSGASSALKGTVVKQPDNQHWGLLIVAFFFFPWSTITAILMNRQWQSACQLIYILGPPYLTAVIFTYCTVYFLILITVKESSDHLQSVRYSCSTPYTGLHLSNKWIVTNWMLT